MTEAADDPDAAFIVGRTFPLSHHAKDEPPEEECMKLVKATKADSAGAESSATSTAGGKQSQE